MKMSNSNNWISDVIDCVNDIDSEIFDLNDVYRYVDVLKEKHPLNNNVEAKIRQQLQVMRDEGFIEFLENGVYKKLH